MNMAFLVPMPTIRATLCGLALAAVAAMPNGVQAAEYASDWARSEAADVRLVSAVAGTEGRDSVPLGLEFRLSEGWKVYWRSAGDVGYPPQVEWQGSSNLAGTDTAFPVPERFSAFGIEQYGYHDNVVYPITARLAESGAPLSLTATVNALVCSDICVPLDAILTLDLPATPPKPTAFTQLLDRWSSRVPGNLPGVGLDVVEARASGDPASPILLVRLASTEPFSKPDVYPEGPEGLSYGKPEISVGPDRRTAELRVPVGVRGDVPLSGAALRLTVVDGDRFVEQTVTVDASPAAGEPANAPVVGVSTWIAMLGAALLGGLILNLMPCVLPVLSIKLLAAVSHGGGHASDVRAGFLATAAGIVASMLVIAAALIAVTAAGFVAGWGIQFQQPVFLAFMVVVVTLFACNLFGMFEISLPQWMSGLALSAGNGPSLGGHFLTGAFATLLATPCSAPFVGTAIGFALSREAPEILMVFAALGLGLALPYVAVAAFPRVATALPRPGPWMITLRRILGLALAATAVWLLSVIAVQIGTEGAILLGAMMALIAAVFALRHVPGSRLGRYSGAAVTLLALAALALPVVRAPDPGISSKQLQAGWQVFDMAELRRIVAGGGTVFVDVTADWCITCQVNKKLVLEQGEVAAWLAGDGVTAMRADWTRPDPAIAAYLAGFGRYGIPFNAIYGPQAPDGIALPELLTDAAVLNIAARAAGGRHAVSR